MIIYIDVNTLALTTEGHVPLTDMALVRGDKVPLRIVLTDGPGQPADARDVPVMAIKKSLGDDALVLAATGMERVTDALGTAYVGSLSVNTVQLATAMGDQDRIDLIGEVVLVAPDGAQRTSRLVRVTVRADLLPGDYAPPAEVLADWSALVSAALAAQLPAALHDAGMNVTPATGSSVLTTGEAETPTTMACYAMEWGDELLAGQMPDHGRLRSVNMTYSGTSAPGSYWLRIWRLVADAYVVAGVSDPEPLPGNNDPITWRFLPGVPMTRGDKVIMEVCAGPDTDHLTTHAMGVHGVMTPPKDGRGRADQVSHPVVITQYDVAPRMTVTVDYDEGVSVGGVEVATVTQIQGLGADIRTASANSQAAAQSASAARDQAQAAVNGLSVTVGAVTTGDPGSQAAAALTPGSTPGSWQLDMTIPRGDVGAVDTAQAYTWTRPQTYDATINANGGVRSTAVLSGLEDMMTLGGGYAVRAFDLSGHVDLRGMQFATAVNVNKLHHPYLMDKDLVVFNEVPAGNNFLCYPVIKFDRYWIAWGTFPPSSIVLSMGGTYMNFEAGEHNAFMGLAIGQNSLAAQRIAEVTPPYIYLKMHSLTRKETTFSIYYNVGDGEQVIERPGLTRSINRLYLIYEQVDEKSVRVSVGVVYGTSNLGVTNRQVTIYRMGVIAVDYYAVGEKVIPFYSNNTTITSISTMQRALGLSIHPGMLITDYFSMTN